MCCSSEAGVNSDPSDINSERSLVPPPVIGVRSRSGLRWAAILCHLHNNTETISTHQYSVLKTNV